jgi:hypothetical protein
MIADLQAAAQGAKRDRAQFRSVLNDLFRAGKPPLHPLTGRYTGSLALLDVAPGLTQLVEALTSTWLPWLGKTFDPATQTGDNVFTRDSLFLGRLFFPFYRGLAHVEATTFRAFTFKTYVAPGLFDPDRDVLKIDYDSADNPALTIRRVLDELVQIGDGAYLGKAHLKWWWGRWQTVAYFILEEK